MYLIEFECALCDSNIEYKWLHKTLFNDFEKAEHCAIQCIRSKISPFWDHDEQTYDNYSYTIYCIENNFLTQVKRGYVECVTCKYADEKQ